MTPLIFEEAAICLNWNRCLFWKCIYLLCLPWLKCKLRLKKNGMDRGWKTLYNQYFLMIKSRNKKTKYSLVLYKYSFICLLLPLLFHDYIYILTSLLLSFFFFNFIPSLYNIDCPSCDRFCNLFYRSQSIKKRLSNQEENNPDILYFLIEVIGKIWAHSYTRELMHPLIFCPRHLS